ncbi:olfactory receptor-like protein OLF1 [Spea bombifrons]|uniref:olfactory receptor-like protein OLF1 n=1 Tax=Spea bombifrons TaxID=233779 RepID=UPI00234BDDAD|nr:olfactory receptor-like protein OLF1 [Spea bombifrons]
MDWSGNISFPEFSLLGFTQNEESTFPLFCIFFFMYIITLLTNIFMVVLIKTFNHLHTPMYFFLGQLSFLDTCYSSVISPRMLINFFTKDRSISITGCAAQMYFFVALGSTESFFLAAMSYDRYVAVCKPLLYIVTMTKPTCISLIVVSYVIGLLHSLIYVIYIFKLPFCKSHGIDHFFCDVLPLLKLSCSDTTLIEILLFTFTGSICMSCLLLIVVSYLLIISTILKIRSAKGRIQTFSTCTSHITVVSIYFGTILFMYLRPREKYKSNQDVVISVFYTIVIPLLNPIIYSVRNREVKTAIRKALGL